MNLLKISIIVLFFTLVNSQRDWSADRNRKRWDDDALKKINHQLGRVLNGNLAKNIIFFLGDGMGVSTVTAGRILKGQKQGRNGEEEITNMENLDHLALSKTYNIDAQTPDSAGTATAYLSGVKTLLGAIGVDGNGVDCKTSLTSKVDSLLQWAYHAGKSTGIVTTTRITHATPAGCYAHVPDREWEAYDGYRFTDKMAQEGCKDIAKQLIEDHNYIDVIIGGGRAKFLPKSTKDYFYDRFGDRVDNLNLIDKWESIMKEKNLKHKFIWNKTDFDSWDPKENNDRILALLNVDHMKYEIERNNSEPSISEMTEKAVKMLSKNPNGFFLLVEGGRIDHAHHDSKAQKALDDFVAFDDAIGTGKSLVSLDDTLIVVTADHSHVFTIGGYAIRGNPLFNTVVSKEGSVSTYGLTFTPLLYGNGPGFVVNATHTRTYNLTNDITSNKDYIQESAVPIAYETHGGEDVAIFASGPMSYLFDGTVEQSYIAHAIGYSACIGPYNRTKFPNCAKDRGYYFKSESSPIVISYSLMMFALISSLIFA